MPSGTLYTYVSNANPKDTTGAIQTSQGIVYLGQAGYFLPSEYQAAEGAGKILVLGNVTPSPPNVPSPNYAYVGADGYVGTPGQGGHPAITFGGKR